MHLCIKSKSQFTHLRLLWRTISQVRAKGRKFSENNIHSAIDPVYGDWRDLWIDGFCVKEVEGLTGMFGLLDIKEQEVLS